MAENKYCYNCRLYSPYYTKGNIKFDRCDIGRCGKTRTTVERHESCEFFSFKYYSRVDRKQAALTALTEHVNALSEIKQILEEDDEEVLEELLESIKKRKKKDK